MECRSCTEALTALMDGELSSQEREAVDRHLHQCPECSQEFESLRMAYDMTTALSQIELRPFLWTRIQGELADSGSFSARPLLSLPNLFSRGWIPVSALAVLFAIIFSFTLLSPPDPIEAEFSSFIESREKLFYEQQESRLEAERYGPDGRPANPFVQRVSQVNQNPFQE